MEKEDESGFRVSVAYAGEVSARAFHGLIHDQGGPIWAGVGALGVLFELVQLFRSGTWAVMAIAWVLWPLGAVFVLYAIYTAAKLDREKTNEIARLKVDLPEKLADLRKSLRERHKSEVDQLKADLERAKARGEKWRRVGAELLSVSLGAKPRPLPNGAPLQATMVLPGLNQAFGRELDKPLDEMACFRFLRAFGITSVEAFEGLLRDKALWQSVADLLQHTGQGALRPIDLCTWGARLYLAPEDERPAVEEEIRAALHRVA